MAAAFVTLTDYYSGKTVGVASCRVLTVEPDATRPVTRINMAGMDGALVVTEPFAIVVARLNGEDQTDGH